MNAILAYIEKNPNKSFAVALLLMFCYQCLNIFFGFEALDPGYYLTIYSNFFEATETVTNSLGSYYLTNLLGASLVKLFPSVGLLGFRILGALLVLLSITIIFYALKKHIPAVHLILGGFLVVICYVKVSNAYTFSNGILSCFLYVCAIVLLFKGLETNGMLFILFGGCIVGINVFSRLPNVLGIGLGLIVLCSPFIFGKEKLFDWKKAMWFCGGCLWGIGLMIIIIILLKQESIFFNNVSNLSNTATSSTSDHSLGKLVIAQLFTYYNGLLSLAIFFTVFYFDKHYSTSRYTKATIRIIAAFFLFYHIYLMPYVCDNTWALCIAGGIFLLSRKPQGSIALYTLLGMYMIIVEPCGTNSGYGQASLPALIIAPIASMAIINRRNFFFVFIACLAIFTKVVRHGTYEDSGPIVQKHSIINHPKAAHIYTTEERAKTFNSVLNDLSEYVQAKDTLLVWDTAPILNYLTDTYPAGGSSCPLYKKSLLNNIAVSGSTPKVLFMKGFNSDRRNFPDNGTAVGTMSLGQFLKKKNYTMVVDNQYMQLYLPQNDSKSKYVSQ